MKLIRKLTRSRQSLIWMTTFITWTIPMNFMKGMLTPFPTSWERHPISLVFKYEVDYD